MLLTLALCATLRVAAMAPRPRATPRDYTYAILHGDFAAARAAMDERLAEGGQVAVPMARERSGGVDKWLLIVTPDHVAVTESMGKMRSDAPIAETKVEGPGVAKPAPLAPGHTPGHFVRLK